MGKISVRSYRPRQVAFDKSGNQIKTSARHPDFQRPRYGKALSLMTLAALSVGLGLSQYIHARIQTLQSKADLLRASKSVMVEKNNSLVLLEAQISAKAQVITLAKRKLKLLEPDQGQVRRL